MSDPAFSHALDPPSRERVCRGCGQRAKLGEFHRVEQVSVKERFERDPPMAQDIPSFSHALDPPSRERVCRGCGKNVKVGEFHRV